MHFVAEDVSYNKNIISAIYIGDFLLSIPAES